MKTLLAILILSAPAFAQDQNPPVPVPPPVDTRTPDQKLCDDLTAYQEAAGAKAAVEDAFSKKYEGKKPSCTAHETNKELESKSGDMKKICTKAQGSLWKYLKYMAKHQNIQGAIEKEIKTVNECDHTDLSMDDITKDLQSLIKK